jgi:RNA polymerase sigma-70 factor (ECF subfamily)
MIGKSHDPVMEGIVAELPRLWRYGLVLSSNRDTAEELVQATCVRALERTHQYQAGTRLDRWLISILHSIWLNEIRSRKVRQGQGLVDADAVLVFDGLQATETNILAGQVLREVQDLPEVQRETVYLVYVEGMTYREAADVLAVPIGTIMSRLAAARAKLADLGREQKSSRDQKSVRDQKFGAEDAPSESSERHDQSGR